MLKQGLMLLGVLMSVAPAAHAGSFASPREPREAADVQRSARRAPTGKNAICLGTKADCEAIHARKRVEAKIEELRSQKDLEQLDVSGW